VDLRTVCPEKEAQNLAKRTRKDPRLVQLILRESKKIIRVEEARGIIITETKHGFICANAGIDSSNIPGNDLVATLPSDPNRSATGIRSNIRESQGITKFAVIISDTFGRPWREGHINFAIGSAGIRPFDDYADQVDTVGKPLRVTKIALTDVFAAASELVCRKTNSVPAALFRGFPFQDSGDDVSSLLRPIEKDLFR
jgi:coenzyme F420-0:L-glutamate ligase/coenzyme F420-1:gamma-L-glutamate ligase